MTINSIEKEKEIMDMAEKLEVVIWDDMRYIVADWLADTCHALSKNAGWWDNKFEKCLTDSDLSEDKVKEILAYMEMLNIATKLTLIHSEVSEGMEGHRKNLKDDKLPHRDMLEVELADAVIRIFDLCGYLEYDIIGAIVEKLSFNQVRPDHKKEAREAENGKKF